MNQPPTPSPGRCANQGWGGELHPGRGGAGGGGAGLPDPLAPASCPARISGSRARQGGRRVPVRAEEQPLPAPGSASAGSVGARTTDPGGGRGGGGGDPGRALRTAGISRDADFRGDPRDARGSGPEGAQAEAGGCRAPAASRQPLSLHLPARPEAPRPAPPLLAPPRLLATPS